MKHMLAVIFVAAALLGDIPTVRADDNLGKRLLVVAETNCQGSTYVFLMACNTIRTMAMNAYEQRILLNIQCSGAMGFEAVCKTAKLDLDVAIERVIFKNMGGR